MTRQRQILVTVTYNDLGCIIDTKAEPYEEPNLQPTCNQLAIDTISRQAAIDEFDGAKVDETYCTEYDSGYNDGIDFAISRLSVMPSAQIERKRGEWIDDYDPVNFGEFRYKCSECGARTVEWADNFCYRCGADMRGEKNGDIY